MRRGRTGFFMAHGAIGAGENEPRQQQYEHDPAYAFEHP